MKKKIIMLVMIDIFSILGVGCGSNKGKKEDDVKYVAFVTDIGAVDDKAFNEGCWNGVKEFADNNGYKKKFFRPVVDLKESREEAIDKAVKSGADVVSIKM